MVVFVVHDPGDLVPLELLVLVCVLALLHVLDMMPCLLGLADRLLSLGCVLDGSCKDGVALFVHLKKEL
jgi:hypothetical protein